MNIHTPYTLVFGQFPLQFSFIADAKTADSAESIWMIETFEETSASAGQSIDTYLSIKPPLIGSEYCSDACARPSRTLAVRAMPEGRVGGFGDTLIRSPLSIPPHSLTTTAE